MLILPAEKRLDWQRPPVALITILILNVIIFFGYQQNDSEKFSTAIDLYIEHDFYSLEKDAYEQYLRLHRADYFKVLQPYQQVADERLIVDMVYDRRFYQFIAPQADTIFAAEKLADWQYNRPLIVASIDSMSSQRFGLKPQNISIVRLLSSQFLHADFMHLLGNMVILLICGFAVEAALGHGRFLAYYLLSGIGGGLLFALVERLTSSSNTSLIGASGAISGVMAIYVAMYRLKKIEFFYWAFIFVGYFRAPALLILPFYVANELYGILSNDNSNVAFTAHIGGFITGGALIAYTLLHQPKAIDDDYLAHDDSTENDPYLIELDAVYQKIADFQFSKASGLLAPMLEIYNRPIDLLLMQYNLLKIENNSDMLTAIASEIVCYKTFDNGLTKQQYQVWLEQQARIEPTLNDHQKITFAIRICDIHHVDSAEKILAELMRNGCKDLMMSKLARNIARHYKNNQQPNKQQRFDSIADSYISL
ncbi:hypothetical protein SIN8267_02761 [Sinobacterium norvegicum]|uniref:Peptidase S54 rhomboid domain-containing protein n=1 Tax=Sinobacterium norvegicum TaxID=1641715 RepID=A0ABM9AHX2_9GAMM|nr:rhomboid family intramembrane serine protease [Sinobacterium norvegicum]CAH0992628.1 hypothetical protein SIN8267_02761 [Sinobacterium norvegicum]